MRRRDNIDLILALAGSGSGGGGGSGANSNIADEFDNSKAYYAGDYAINAGFLYKFLCDKPAGDWDSSVVESVTLGADLTNVYNDVLAAFPTETVSGAVVSVTDGADDLPVRSLKVGISPAQSGTGVPAPDNLRNISGRTGASVFRAGRNMFDEATAVLYDRFINVSATPKLWSYDASSKSIAFPCKPNTTYSVSCLDPDAETVITVFRVGWIESGIPSAISTSPAVSGVVNVGAAGSVTLTTGEYATHIVVQLNAAILSARSARLQIELGSAATPYEAYRGAACVFDWESEAGTVYGGTLDVTAGVLTVDRGLKVFTGQESGWEKFSNDNSNGTYFGLAGTTAYAAFSNDPEAICSINKRSSAAEFASGDGFYWTSGGWRILYGAAHAGESLDDFKAYVQQKYAAGTPVAVCAKLASPQTYQLTPAEVKTLLAENTLWADCGDVIELIFRADPTLFVEQEVSTAEINNELLITPTRTETMVAPANIIKGELLVAEHKLYKASAAIASGAALTPGSNIDLTSVAEELNGINNLFAWLDKVAPPEMHRQLYRGKYLGETITTAQKAAIADGTFHDIWLGDYWGTIRKLTIVDFDYWYQCGDVSFDKHHVVVMPAANMYSAKMNDTNTTAGGYYGSLMRGVEVEGVFTPYAEGCGLYNALLAFQSVFGDALLTHREYLCNAVSGNAESAGSWYDSIIELPSEIMIYGTSIRTPMPRIATVSKTQLALLAASPKFIFPSRATTWLRDVVSAAGFAIVYNGYASLGSASDSAGVRPVAAIGG